MIRNTTKHQKLGWVLFILYLLLLVYFLFFAEAFGRTDAPRTEDAINLIPFKEINRYWTYREKMGMKIFLLNIVGNIAGFMPCGFFLPIVSRRSRHWYNAIFISFAFSFLVECTQLAFRVGSCDVDDVILNTTGAVLGYLCYQIVQQCRIWRRKRGRNK